MKLSGIEFENVWNASGARNFYGDSNAWWWHRFWRPFGLKWEDSTLVSKTTTFEPRPGNMPLKDLQPTEFFPKCIKVKFYDGVVLNAVGLSGPGLDFLLAANKWQRLREPFVMSFMAVDPTPAERLLKLQQLRDAFKTADGFSSHFAIEINLSCPNVGLDPVGLIKEAKDILDVFGNGFPYKGFQSTPVILKFNALVPVNVAREIASHKACSAITVSNTIPWGLLPEKINWTKLFGDTSPLTKYGGGGLSGMPLFPIVKEWVFDASKDFPVPIIACGGIMDKYQAEEMMDSGAAAVQLGCVAILRPWRVAGIIRHLRGK